MGATGCCTAAQYRPLGGVTAPRDCAGRPARRGLQARGRLEQTRRKVQAGAKCNECRRWCIAGQTPHHWRRPRAAAAHLGCWWKGGVGAVPTGGAANWWRGVSGAGSGRGAAGERGCARRAWGGAKRARAACGGVDGGPAGARAAAASMPTERERERGARMRRACKRRVLRESLRPVRWLAAGGRAGGGAGGGSTVPSEVTGETAAERAPLPAEPRGASGGRRVFLNRSDSAGGATMPQEGGDRPPRRRPAPHKWTGDREPSQRANAAAPAAGGALYDVPGCCRAVAAPPAGGGDRRGRAASGERLRRLVGRGGERGGETLRA